MKRPISPAYSAESLPALSVCENEQPESPAMDVQTKREKRLPSFTLCEVCNIQLNSAVQAQIHFNGKSHQKRLKKINKGKISAHDGKLRIRMDRQLGSKRFEKTLFNEREHYH